jgi:hypothetical protein
MPVEPGPYRSRAVRALVILHEQHMRTFLATWNAARAIAVRLPATEDPSYASLETLRHHVLGAARGYMTWICEQLQLPDPGIRRVPESMTEQEARSYMEHLLEGWRGPLRDVRDDQLEQPEYPSHWKTLYSIDAMLEHAVMHPIRHVFQLEELMKTRQGPVSGGR